MPPVNLVNISSNTYHVDCKSTAKSAETSALPAVQQYLNHFISFGSSSAVAMIPISHLVNQYIIIHLLILSLDICRGQLVLFGLRYIIFCLSVNVIIYIKHYIILYHIYVIILSKSAFVMRSLTYGGVTAFVAPIYSKLGYLVSENINMNKFVYVYNKSGLFLMELDLSANIIIFIKWSIILHCIVNIILIKSAFVMRSLTHGGVTAFVAPIYSKLEQVVSTILMCMKSIYGIIINQ